jgi:hypothetical protein
MVTIGWVLALARERYGIELTQGEHRIAVDMDGLGKGVGDRLREQGCRVVEMRGNMTAAEEPNKYGNRRAEAYGQLAARLDPAESSDPFPLPDDRELLDELVAPERLYVGSDGFKFRLTPKDKRPGQTFRGFTIREKLGRSPDKADAVVYCYQAVREARSSLSEWIDAGAF